MNAPSAPSSPENSPTSSVTFPTLTSILEGLPPPYPSLLLDPEYASPQPLSRQSSHAESVHTSYSEDPPNYEEAAADPPPNFMKTLQEMYLEAMIERALKGLKLALGKLSDLMDKPLLEGEYAERKELIEKLACSLSRMLGDSQEHAAIYNEQANGNPFENAFSQELECRESN